MDKIIENLYTLFDAAWEENMNGRGTDITRMVTTFVPAAIQDLQAFRDMFDIPDVNLLDCNGMTDEEYERMVDEFNSIPEVYPISYDDFVKGMKIVDKDNT